MKPMGIMITAVIMIIFSLFAINLFRGEQMRSLGRMDEQSGNPYYSSPIAFSDFREFMVQIFIIIFILGFVVFFIGLFMYKHKSIWTK